MTDAQVAVLLDRQAISEVLINFCRKIDEYDIAGLVEVFTPDCFTDYGPARGGPVHGVERVLDRIRRGQAEFRRTQHQLGQSHIDIDGDCANAMTYVTATHEDWTGSVSRVHLRYVDRMRRTPLGWRIADRRVFACVVDGMSGDWNYVKRQEPQ